MDRKPLASINITPFVDVLLILLVILMLAMPLFVKRLPVDLPQTALAGAPIIVKALPVSLTLEGTLMSGDSILTIDDLKKQVKSDTTLEVSADKNVTYEALAKLIGDLQALGPKEINLVTR